MYGDTKMPTARLDRLIHHCAIVETGHDNWRFKSRGNDHITSARLVAVIRASSASHRPKLVRNRKGGMPANMQKPATPTKKMIGLILSSGFSQPFKSQNTAMTSATERMAPTMPAALPVGIGLMALFALLRPARAVEARITQRTVEIFLRGKRVASHLRSTLPHRPTTIPEHMPSSHRRYRDWTHERIRSDATKVGPDAETLIDVILRSRPHPEQGFRSAIGILGLVRRYGQERVDAACARALLLNARSYKSVAAILKNGTDRTAPAEEAPVLFHANIRGRSYYN